MSCPVFVKSPLRIVLLEDSVLDAQMVEQELRNAGYSFDLKRIQTEAELHRELDRSAGVKPCFELEELGDRVRGLLGEYFERLVRPELRPPGARQVSWLSIAFPNDYRTGRPVP